MKQAPSYGGFAHLRLAGANISFTELAPSLFKKILDPLILKSFLVSKSKVHFKQGLNFSMLFTFTQRTKRAIIMLKTHRCNIRIQ